AVDHRIWADWSGGRQARTRLRYASLRLLAQADRSTSHGARRRTRRNAGGCAARRRFRQPPRAADSRDARLIDADALQTMKRSAILINTTRGGTVDQAALVSALRDGTIAGAALDVTDPEPLPADDPILTLPNALVVPHIGSATVATRRKMALMAADNLIAGVRGEPLPNRVS
ncbi:MAG: hypothetical protein CUN53_14865, partial [Phototrophicales bacterium]